MFRVSIIGMGLIGASLGMALRSLDEKESPFGEVQVVGYDLDKRALKEARGRLAIDREANSLVEAVRDAQIVILATPVGAIEGLLKQLASALPTGALVTDVASTKAQVEQWARQHLPSGIHFIGGHPMAGSEQSGPGAADPDLLVLLEVPAILVAIVLHRRATGGDGEGESYGTVVKEMMVNRSVFLLIAGLIVGFLSGQERFEAFALLFQDASRPILAFFILEMGLLASLRLKEIRRAGPFLIVFALAWPVLLGMGAAALGITIGLSPAGATVFAAMVASASYIAAPAAIRIAIPEANTAMSIAASLGLTFPFNLLFGIPLFAEVAIRCS